MSPVPSYRIVKGDTVTAYLLSHTPVVVEGLRTIGLERDGKIVAAVGYNAWLGGCCEMHVAGVEFTRPFIRACFDYPFRQLGLPAVIGLVDERNERALTFDKRIGFREVYRVKGGAGEADLVILEMRRDECRWIGKTHG